MEIQPWNRAFVDEALRLHKRGPLALIHFLIDCSHRTRDSAAAERAIIRTFEVEQYRRIFTRRRPRVVE